MTEITKIRKQIRSAIDQIWKRITVKVFIVILLFVLPFNIFSVVLSNLVMREMQEKLLVSIQSVLENHSTIIKNRIEMGSFLLIDAWQEDVNLEGMLNPSDDMHYEFHEIWFSTEFADKLDSCDGFDHYFFVVKDKKDTLLLSDGRKSVSIEKAMWADCVGATWEKGWHMQNIGERECLYLYMENKDLTYGGWFYLDEISELLEGDIQYEQEYSTFTYGVGEDADNKLRLSSNITEDIYLNVYLDRNEVLSEIRNVRLYIMGALLILLCLLPILYFSTHRMLLVPLKVLRNGFENVESGNLNYRIEEHASSLEYEYSFKSFNNMLDKTQDLIEENYVKELEKKKMELQNLQLQIRPHFLLNTFNLIYALAQKHEYEAIQDIILYLSKYFRYMFREGKDLELFQIEQTLIEGYIKMVQIHYPDSIEIEYDYDPEIMYVRVPPLLIHNFVENIIKHVVKQGTVTHISIIGQYEKGYVTFLIMDDGQGISQKKLAKLDKDMRRGRSDGKRVGLYNSLKRLKIFYGEEANIEVTSEEGQGTCVAVTFPYNLGELKIEEIERGNV